MTHLAFQELCYFRDTLVCDVGPWLWLKEDTGAWNGPHQEFPGLKEKIAKKTWNKRVIVQAGGNLGLYPRLWSDVFQTVYTFEPDPKNFFCLNHNCQKANIIKFNAALGEKAGTIWLNGLNNTTNVGMHKVDYKKQDNASLQVQVMTVDSLNLEHCDAIQLDVEDFEPSVLAGAIETIKRCKPIISVERGRRFEESKTILETLGYVEYDTNVADTLFYIPK